MQIQQHLNNLSELLRIPSISAQKKHDKDIKKAAAWLNQRLNSIGFTSKIMKTGGHPVVYGEYLKAGENKPTILIYGHYDVQAPEPIKEWNTNPFEPQILGGNIYARGASDDKGQLYTWIAALEELLNDKKKLPVNVKILIEGEEETGGINLDEFVKDNTALLKSEICVISDTHCLSEDQPMIDYGLRGLVYMELHVKSLAKDAHSGLYGGNVLNPANVLCEIIAKLKNDDHTVAIPGFYDNVRQLKSTERDELAKLPFSEEDLRRETGAFVVTGEEGFSVHERAGARPTLDVNGIWGGYINEGPKTIIPGEAHAKISMRLVPKQTSSEIAGKFESYVREIAPSGVEIEVNLLSGGEPILIDRTSKYFRAAELAYEKVFGTKPVYELSGGSIPVTAVFKDTLGIDSILMGYGLPDDGLHSPNEKLSLEMFEKGILTNMEFIRNLE